MNLLRHFRGAAMLPVLLFALTAHAAPAKPPATVTIKSSEFHGIRESVLPNGLTVLTREVHTAPVVYFSVWYRAGSRNEQVGQTGMSHLMEHMLFKGTRRRGPGVISRTLQDNGAEFNANTWFDRTCYFETLASDRLELAMQIESDRMVNSLFDEGEHQKEMTVVRSEYEGGENNPSSALNKAVRLAAFQIHPYRWTTIGFRSDIENFSRDEMLAYYHNYYVPNNAVIVMVGDFQTDRALALVRQYFGVLPAKKVVSHFITPEPKQEGERRVVVRRAGTTREAQIAYHIPAISHPDRYALDVMESALSGGRTARFFQRLLQTGLASQAEAYDYGLRDPDLCFLQATAQPGHTNAELEQALLAEVEKLQQEPITDEELKRAISQAEAGYIFEKDSVQAQGRQLGENAMRGDWKYGETYTDHLRKVTAADVQRVARQYLVVDNRTVGYFEPLGDAEPKATPAAATSAMPMADGAAPTPASAPTAAAAATPPITVSRPTTKAAAKPTRVVLDNGVTVIVRENHANPTISLNGALLCAGSIYDPADKPGLSDFTAGQLSRGTSTRSLLDIARVLEGAGMTVSVRGQQEYVSLGGRALARDFNTMLEVLADELRNPAFPADELEKARRQSLARLRQARQSTGTLAQIEFMNALFPKGHPYHRPTLDEQEAVVKNLTRDDLVAFHGARYAPDRLVLTIVGDVTAADAVAAVKRYFGDWTKKGNLAPAAIPDTPLAPDATKAIVVPVADKAQSDVIYGYPGQLRRGDPDFYRVMVMNTILGGGSGLTSRLARSVRDRLGLVYTVYSSFDAGLGEGPYTVSLGANPANVDKAVAEVERQIDYMRVHGVTPREVKQTIDFLTGSYAVTLSTNSAVAQQLLIAEIFGLGLDYIEKRNDLYRAVTVEQVNAAARQYLHPGKGALVIAGTYSGKYAAK